MVSLRPGSQPIETLCAGLERALADDTTSAEAIRSRIDEVREGQGAKPGALAYLLKLAIPEGQQLLLVIDQLEELFTLNDVELFDLESDPDELINRFDAEPARAAALERELRAICDPEAESRRSREFVARQAEEVKRSYADARVGD